MSLLQTIEICAVIVSAVYGILLAARQGMDVVGVFVVACVVAFGGERCGIFFWTGTRSFGS
jgi:uncharacterized membrane protein YeiH